MTRRRNVFGRKPVDYETREPVIILGTGEFNVEEKKRLKGMFALLGIEAEVISPEAYQKRLERMARVVVDTSEQSTISDRFKFSTLTDPDQYLVREHVEDLFASNPKLREWPRGIGRTFNYLVDGANQDRSVTPVFMEADATFYKELRSPRPPQGLVVKPRSSVNIEEYAGATPMSRGTLTYYCAHYAVQAGSIVELTEHLGLRDSPRHLQVREVGLLTISDQLQAQFQPDISE